MEEDLELTGEEPWLRKAEMQEEREAVGVWFQREAAAEMEDLAVEEEMWDMSLEPRP
jgi:hypothetical protein